jgi:hypothetical protein
VLGVNDMKKIVLLLIFISTYSVVNAAIKQHIEFDTTLIYRDWANPPWLFVGTFDFERLPQPLQPTKVKFELKAVRDDKPDSSPKDWRINLIYNDNAVKILSDTIFYWPPPHKIGDIFNGIINFVPMMAGVHAIALDMASGKRNPPAIAFQEDLSFRWLIDEDGILRHLDQYSGPIDKRYPSGSYFFTQDSVYIKSPPDRWKKEIFEYEITIKPAPKINDTSTIKFRLIANREINDGYEIAYGLNNMDLVIEPKKISRSVIKGEMFDVELGFVPRAIEKNHSIGLTVYNTSDSTRRGSGRQSIGVSFAFDNNMNLKYVYDEHTGSPQYIEAKHDYSKELYLKNPTITGIIKSGK